MGFKGEVMPAGNANKLAEAIYPTIFACSITKYFLEPSHTATVIIPPHAGRKLIYIFTPRHVPRSSVTTTGPQCAASSLQSITWPRKTYGAVVSWPEGHHCFMGLRTSDTNTIRARSKTEGEAQCWFKHPEKSRFYNSEQEKWRDS